MTTCRTSWLSDITRPNSFPDVSDVKLQNVWTKNDIAKQILLHISSHCTSFKRHKVGTRDTVTDHNVKLPMGQAGVATADAPADWGAIVRSVSPPTTGVGKVSLGM
jgi:hypothetical protein